MLEAVSHIGAAGGTAILDSLVEIVGKLPTDQGRCAIVLITDGYDENSVTSTEDALAAVKAARVTVYVVGIGGIAGISTKGERLLRRIAKETGGQAFFPREKRISLRRRSVSPSMRRIGTWSPTRRAIRRWTAPGGPSSF